MCAKHQQIGVMIDNDDEMMRRCTICDVSEFRNGTGIGLLSSFSVAFPFRKDPLNYLASIVIKIKTNRLLVLQVSASVMFDIV